MTNEAVHAMTAPLAAHSEMVRIFAGRFGATATAATPNGDMVTVTVDVETAERMLGAKYVALEHVKSGEVVHRAPGGYTLPVEVAAAVDFVSPTTHVPGVRCANGESFDALYGTTLTALARPTCGSPPVSVHAVQ